MSKDEANRTNRNANRWTQHLEQVESAVSVHESMQILPIYRKIGDRSFDCSHAFADAGMRQKSREEKNDSARECAATGFKNV